MGRDIEKAIAETQREIRVVQRNTRQRRMWNFVRTEVLVEWAAARGETNVEARMEALTRTYFAARDDAAVVQGTDSTNASLYAVWVGEGAPTFDPPWDGLTPAQRAALEAVAAEQEESALSVADEE
jgi:hypothetical protein